MHGIIDKSEIFGLIGSDNYQEEVIMAKLNLQTAKNKHHKDFKEKAFFNKVLTLPNAFPTLCQMHQNNYIDNNHDLSGLPLKGREDIPSLTDTSWKSIPNNDTFNKSKGSMQYNQLPTEDGLYYLWIQGSDTGVKTVYGQAVIEIGTVTKITSTTDQNNDNKDPNTTQNNTGNSTTGKTDPTTANKILPNTGISIAIIGTILLVIVLGIGSLAKYYTYKDVK